MRNNIFVTQKRMKNIYGLLKNGKLRVAIKTCENGHKYVPVRDECLICKRIKNMLI